MGDGLGRVGGRGSYPVGSSRCAPYADTRWVGQREQPTPGTKREKPLVRLHPDDRWRSTISLHSSRLSIVLRSFGCSRFGQSVGGCRFDFHYCHSGLTFKGDPSPASSWNSIANRGSATNPRVWFVRTSSIGLPDSDRTVGRSANEIVELDSRRLEGWNCRYTGERRPRQRAMRGAAFIDPAWTGGELTLAGILNRRSSHVIHRGSRAATSCARPVFRNSFLFTRFLPVGLREAAVVLRVKGKLASSGWSQVIPFLSSFFSEETSLLVFFYGKLEMLYVMDRWVRGALKTRPDENFTSFHIQDLLHLFDVHINTCRLEEIRRYNLARNVRSFSLDRSMIYLLPITHSCLFARFSQFSTEFYVSAI